jgi:hypothetical protein
MTAADQKLQDTGFTLWFRSTGTTASEWVPLHKGGLKSCRSYIWQKQGVGWRGIYLALENDQRPEDFVRQRHDQTEFAAGLL